MPVALDGERLGLVELIEATAEIAARHGVGIVDHIEDRIVGLKVRDIYEAPAAAVILAAHQELERLVCTIHQNQFKPDLDRQWAYLVYAGLWWEPLREDLDAYMDRVNEQVTGTIGLKLYKGHARVVTRSSPNAVYDAVARVLRRVRRAVLADRLARLHRAVLAAVAHGLAAAQRAPSCVDAARRRVRRYRLLGLLAWRGARQARRHRWLGLLAWRGTRLYLRRRRLALWLSFAAAVALGGALCAARARRRPVP